MTTKLNSAFKRELDINGDKYTLAISPEGFKLVPKGKRRGVELTWSSIIGGDAALATALNASVAGTRPPVDPMSRSPLVRAHTKH